MNDRLSAFCTGVGFAGLLVGLGLLTERPWLLAVLVSWSVVLLPIGVVDAVCDYWRRR